MQNKIRDHIRSTTTTNDERIVTHVRTINNTIYMLFINIFKKRNLKLNYGYIQLLGNLHERLSVHMCVCLRVSKFVLTILMRNHFTGSFGCLLYLTTHRKCIFAMNDEKNTSDWIIYFFLIFPNDQHAVHYSNECIFWFWKVSLVIYATFENCNHKFKSHFVVWFHNRNEPKTKKKKQLI